jgi:hypothetical protein
VRVTARSNNRLAIASHAGGSLGRYIAAPAATLLFHSTELSQLVSKSRLRQSSFDHLDSQRGWGAPTHPRAPCEPHEMLLEVQNEAGTMADGLRSTRILRRPFVSESFNDHGG